MRQRYKFPIFLGIIALAAFVAGIFLAVSFAPKSSASLSVALVGEDDIVKANYTHAANPLAVVFQSPLPGGGTTQVEIRSKDQFWITPVVKIKLEKLTSDPAQFTVKLKITSRTATWGNQQLVVENFASTVMEKDFSYTNAGTYELSGVGNGKIACSTLLASPPTAALPNKQLRITYNITIELYSAGVLIGSQSTSATAELNFQYMPDGAVSISSVNIQPTWVQVI